MPALKILRACPALVRKHLLDGVGDIFFGTDGGYYKKELLL